MIDRAPVYQLMRLRIVHDKLIFRGASRKSPGAGSQCAGVGEQGFIAAHGFFHQCRRRQVGMHPRRVGLARRQNILRRIIGQKRVR